MKSRYSISVIFPGYNEEENITKTITRAIEALNRQFETFEIIVVDDASTDKTPQLANALSAADPRVRVVRNESNLRQGASILKGFKLARYELVTHNGMDYPFDLNDLEQLLPLLENNDIVVAARTSRPGYTIYRTILSHANLFLLRTLFPLKLSDYSFIQVYKRAIFERVEPRAISTGFAMPELVLRAHRAGFRVAEKPIKYLRREAGIARAGHPRVLVESLRELVRYWVETR